MAWGVDSRGQRAELRGRSLASALAEPVEHALLADEPLHRRAILGHVAREHFASVFGDAHDVLDADADAGRLFVESRLDREAHAGHEGRVVVGFVVDLEADVVARSVAFELPEPLLLEHLRARTRDVVDRRT